MIFKETKHIIFENINNRVVDLITMIFFIHRMRITYILFLDKRKSSLTQFIA